MISDHKFEVRGVDNGFVITFYQWEEINGNPCWLEDGIECYTTFEAVMQAAKDYMDKVTIGK